MVKKLLFFPILLFGCLKLHAATTTDYVAYGATTAITCSGLNGLSASASVGTACLSVANTGATPAFDAYVTVIATNSSGSPASPYSVQVYISASQDNVNFEEDLSSSPAGGGSYTIATTGITNLHLATAVNLDTAGKQNIRSFSVLNTLGYMPQYWDVIIVNNTGQSLAASGNAVYYQYLNFKNQ